MWKMQENLINPDLNLRSGFGVQMHTSSRKGDTEYYSNIIPKISEIIQNKKIKQYLIEYFKNKNAYILFSHMIQLWEQNNYEKFCKFNEKCQHPDYEKFGSFCEDLGWNRKKFVKVRDIFCKKLKTGTKKEKVFSEALIVFYTDISRKTWYIVNLPSIISLFEPIGYDIRKNMYPFIKDYTKILHENHCKINNGTFKPLENKEKLHNGQNDRYGNNGQKLHNLLINKGNSENMGRYISNGQNDRYIIKYNNIFKDNINTFKDNINIFKDILDIREYLEYLINRIIENIMKEIEEKFLSKLELLEQRDNYLKGSIEKNKDKIDMKDERNVKEEIKSKSFLSFENLFEQRDNYLKGKMKENKDKIEENRVKDKVEENKIELKEVLENKLDYQNRRENLSFNRKDEEYKDIYLESSLKENKKDKSKDKVKRPYFPQLIRVVSNTFKEGFANVCKIDDFVFDIPNFYGKIKLKNGKEVSEFIRMNNGCYIYVGNLPFYFIPYIRLFGSQNFADKPDGCGSPPSGNNPKKKKSIADVIAELSIKKDEVDFEKFDKVELNPTRLNQILNSFYSSVNHPEMVYRVVDKVTFNSMKKFVRKLKENFGMKNSDIVRFLYELIHNWDKVKSHPMFSNYGSRIKLFKNSIVSFWDIYKYYPEFIEVLKDLKKTKKPEVKYKTFEEFQKEKREPEKIPTFATEQSFPQDPDYEDEGLVRID